MGRKVGARIKVVIVLESLLRSADPGTQLPEARVGLECCHRWYVDAAVTLDNAEQ